MSKNFSAAEPKDPAEDNRELETWLALPEPTTAAIPQELVWHIAAGLENADTIAARFGYEGEVWERLKRHKPFVVAVEQLRAEFESSGFTAKNKFRLMATDLSERLYMMARTNDASVGQVLEIFKTFAKLADLEPKPEKVAQDVGTGFSITINLAGAPAAAPTTIDVTPQVEGA